MKNYILTIKPKSGLLTKLQSDTIYGHFCWRLKEKSGTQKLTDFISLYREGKPVFLVSDGMLKSESEIQFPKPFLFRKPVYSESRDDKILDFVKRKKEKEKNFFSLEQLNAFLNNNAVQDEVGNEADSEGGLTGPIVEEQLRISVQIDRSNFAAEDKKLFSYNPIFLRNDFSYAILIKVLDEDLYSEFECEQILKDVFLLGYGKKKSSGYGQFDEDIRFEHFDGLKEPEEGNGFIVLGNYLPLQEDLVNPAGYDINTKYGKLGEELAQSNNPFKNPIVFHTAGSCFHTTSKRKYYGRITHNGEVSESFKETVQFGCPFFLRILV